VASGLLRFEISTAPQRQGSCEAIEADLGWLGLDWDGPALFQMSAAALTTRQLASARSSGQLYPCHCKRPMLAIFSSPHGGGPPYQVSARRSCRLGYQGWPPQLALAAGAGRPALA